MAQEQDLLPQAIQVAARKNNYDMDQVALIRDTVAKDASIPELAMFLELCARYKLDPFAGQIYCAKMRNQNGEGGRVQIIVGRDGFLRIADSHPDFEGFDSDVVRKNDTFKKVVKDGIPVVTHEYEEGGENDRGEIVGAWAIAYRTGRRPRYFMAYKSEYMPKSEAKLRYSPWGAQESVMMEKCAITTVLRLAFNISGVVGEEEASRQLLDTPSQEIEWPEDQQLTSFLAALFAECNRVKPGSFRAKKQVILLRGKTDEEGWALAEELSEFIRKHEGTVPSLPEAETGEVVEEGEVAETTTVEDEAAVT